MRRVSTKIIYSLVVSLCTVGFVAAQDHSAHQQTAPQDTQKTESIPASEKTAGTVDHSQMDMSAPITPSQGKKPAAKKPAKKLAPQPAVDHSQMDMSTPAAPTQGKKPAAKKPAKKPAPQPAVDHSQMDMSTPAAPSQGEKPAPKKPASKQPATDHSGMDMTEQKSSTGQDHSGMDMSMPDKNLEQLIKESPTNLVLPTGSVTAETSGPVYTLQQLEQVALQKNPTIAQADAERRVAFGRRVQAGLLPNPVIGYAGDEIRGGSFGGGQHGGFIEQTFVLGGKLGLARKAAEQDVKLAEIGMEAQRIRVTNSVRSLYFQVLGEQEQLVLNRSAVLIAEETLATAQRLRNIGMSDPSEVLQAEIQLNRAQLNAMTQENHLRRQWKTLAAAVGDPQLKQGRLEGRLDQDLPDFNEERLLQELLATSPAVRAAEVGVRRSEALIAQARRLYFPDLSVRAGLQQNRELIDGTGKRIGLQGSAEVGLQIPIFNRNQGNVLASQAHLARSVAERTRIELRLRERAAIVMQHYQDARFTAEQYKTRILPKARQVYEMNLKAWGQMATSYPQVLIAQQNLFQLQSEYIESLTALRVSAVELQGNLLTDGLEAPTEMK